MDTTQLAQMVTWLDEQHRRDRAEIARLQQRLEAQTNEAQEQGRRIQELEARITSTQAQLSRFSQIEQSLQNFKNELTIMINAQAEENSKAMREVERSRMTDREATSRALTEVRKELPRFRPIEEELAVRKAEDHRLSEIVINLRSEVTEIGKSIEERTRALPYLAEQRNHDNRRIVQLQQENVELFKRLEEASSKLSLLEQRQQKSEGHVQTLPPLVETMKRGQEQFVESLKLADADRQRQMRDWQVVFDNHQKTIEEQRKRLQEYAAITEESKRAVAALEQFQTRIQREQNQVAELQRLAEDRQRKEMEGFLTDNEKRLKKQSLEWQYQWDQQNKINATIREYFPRINAQLALHNDLLHFQWRYIDVQGEAQLSAAQKWLGDVQKLVEQRQAILKAHQEAKAEVVESSPPTPTRR